MSIATKSGWIERARAGLWLRTDTVAHRARVLLVINLILVAWAVVVLQRPMPGAPLVSSDFISFYAAGSLALQGRASDAYDLAAHQRAEADVIGPDRAYQFFYYPPPYLVLCSALAVMPYLPALIVFEAATLGLLLLALRGICGWAGWRVWLWPVLAFTPLFWTIGLGQNAFLSAALLAGGTLLVDRRPLLAGLLFGLLCYKPHLGLLVPIALAAGGRWRCFVAAGGAAAGLLAASWLLYGSQTWVGYLQSFLDSGQTYGSGRIAFAGMISPFGAARLAGLPVTLALAIQGVAGLSAAGVVAWVWRRSHSQAVRSATLLAATTLAVPVLLLYDQMITLVALAWLAREVRTDGALPWERLVLAGAYLLPLLGFPLSLMLNVPLAPLPAVMLLALCVLRTQLGGRSQRLPIQRTLLYDNGVADAGDTDAVHATGLVACAGPRAVGLRRRAAAADGHCRTPGFAGDPGSVVGPFGRLDAAER